MSTSLPYYCYGGDSWESIFSDYVLVPDEAVDREEIFCVMSRKLKYCMPRLHHAVPLVLLMPKPDTMSAAAQVILAAHSPPYCDSIRHRLANIIEPINAKFCICCFPSSPPLPPQSDFGQTGSHGSFDHHCRSDRMHLRTCNDLQRG